MRRTELPRDLSRDLCPHQSDPTRPRLVLDSTRAQLHYFVHFSRRRAAVSPRAPETVSLLARASLGSGRSPHAVGQLEQCVIEPQLLGLARIILSGSFTFLVLIEGLLFVVVIRRWSPPIKCWNSSLARCMLAAETPFLRPGVLRSRVIRHLHRA